MSSLPVEFNGFSGAKAQVFSVGGAGHIDLEAACPVAILQGENNKISVEIDADPKDMSDFVVRQQGDKVSVHQKGSVSGATIVMGGRGGISISSISGGNVSIINGRVFVDGKEVKPGQQGASESTKTPRIIIKAPANGDIDAKMQGASLLLSAVPHNEAYLDLSGQTKVGITAKELNIDASGQSEVKAIVGGGELSVDLSGQGSVQAQGTFSKVKAELSGMGSIETQGTVNGDYKAEASGMGSISHRGQIHGRIRKDASGMARINLG